MCASTLLGELGCELVMTYVGGHIVIWKVNLWEGGVETGLEDLINNQ